MTTFLFLFLFSGLSEREWCAKLAPKYKADAEVVLYDRSRVDLLTETEAIEVDWAKKWPEAVGQSLYYAIVTKKKPAVLLLVSDPDKERSYILRCLSVCAKHEITLYIERVD